MTEYLFAQENILEKQKHKKFIGKRIFLSLFPGYYFDVNVRGER